MNTEYGRLATTNDMLMYGLIVEQRKTNELLERLILQSAPVQAVEDPKPVLTDKPVPTVGKKGNIGKGKQAVEHTPEAPEPKDTPAEPDPGE